MKTKQVNRYTCEFCGKHGYSARHMAKHEKHCTKNPERVCRVCGMLEHEQPNLETLKGLLPNGKEWMEDALYRDENLGLVREFGAYNRLTKVVNAVLPELRKSAGDCPACIMAALRQSNIPVPIATDFNFTNEMKAIWAEINESIHQRDMDSCRHG